MVLKRLIFLYGGICARFNGPGNVDFFVLNYDQGS